MKKLNFIAGLCAGLALSAGSIAFASDSVQAVLFPSKVHFLVNGTVKEFEGTEDDAILNYNNKTYIPLRTFAEFMGATVNYQYASEATGNKHVIDIYSGMTENDFNLTDPEGYVSLRLLKTEQQPNSNTIKITGLLKVNKDLTGKKVQIDALDKDGKSVGSIDADINNNLALGDIISLNSGIIVRGEVNSFQVQTRDTWGLITMDYFSQGFLQDMAGLEFGKGQIDTNKKGLVQTLRFKNQEKQAITIKPLTIEYQILKVDGDTEEVLLNSKLAPLEGIIPGYGWYEAKLPVWNLRDQYGNPVPGQIHCTDCHT